MRDHHEPGPGQRPSWRDRLLSAYRRRGWRGFVRLYSLLKPVGSGRIRTVCKYGSQFFLTPWDSVDTHVIAEGFYESEVLEEARAALAPRAVVWVVGANFGLHAVTLKFLHPDVTVVAFEPSPAMGARIIENCELNNVKLDLHTYALSDKLGALPFFANASGNPGISTLHPVDFFKYDHKMVVATLTAEQVIMRGIAPAPTVAIIDAEGAEADVLRGFGPQLQAPALRTIVFEADNEFLATRQPEDVHALIMGAGFAVRRLARNEQTAHALSNFVASRA